VSAESRPALTGELTGAELLRWYWLKSELIQLARALGINASGGKLDLTARLAAALDSAPAGGPTDAGPRASTAPAAKSRRARLPTARLAGPLTSDTVIPPGQRSSQLLRAFFEEQLGTGFRFDASMREFIATGDRTLGEALQHWRDTRQRRSGEIAPQFELNRFLRSWHAAHPDEGRAAALAAWREHRAKPVEARDRL
jgi:hypothetical protein